MANHIGSEGNVKVGANQIAEITSWEVNRSAEIIEDTALGDAAKTYKPGTTDDEVSFSAHWDETDTTGQGALDPGQEVTINLYPEGSGAGATYWTGSLIITSKKIAVGGNDEVISADFSGKVNGGLTETTV